MSVKLSRVPEGKVYGVQYNGENISEVLNFYFSSKEVVGINVSDKMLKHGETYIFVGDWVVNDAGMRRIVRKGEFKTLYVESDVPEGYKKLDVYGNEIK